MSYWANLSLDRGLNRNSLKLNSSACIHCSALYPLRVSSSPKSVPAAGWKMRFLGEREFSHSKSAEPLVFENRGKIYPQQVFSYVQPRPDRYAAAAAFIHVIIYLLFHTYKIYHRLLLRVILIIILIAFR